MPYYLTRTTDDAPAAERRAYRRAARRIIGATIIRTTSGSLVVEVPGWWQPEAAAEADRRLRKDMGWEL